MEYYILIAGNGNTTRANVEALIDDYFILNKDSVVVLPFERTPTLGQKWAAQYAKDNDKKIILYSLPDSKNVDCQRDEQIETDTPFEDAVAFIADKENAAFLLWDDEDTESTEVLRLCKAAKVRCFDLTSGLYEITPTENIKPVEKPVMPKQEIVVNPPVPVVEEDSDFEEEEEEEEDDEEEVEVEEVLTDAITYIAQIFAREVALELKKIMGK